MSTNTRLCGSSTSSVMAPNSLLTSLPLSLNHLLNRLCAFTSTSWLLVYLQHTHRGSAASTGSRAGNSATQHNTLAHPQRHKHGAQVHLAMSTASRMAGVTHNSKPDAGGQQGPWSAAAQHTMGHRMHQPWSPCCTTYCRPAAVCCADLSFSRTDSFCASALQSDVLPVPGGPCSSTTLQYNQRRCKHAAQPHDLL